MIGPGKAIDTDKYFVICSNVLGGCKGSTGPSSINPLTNKPYGIAFPQTTIRDMVNAQHHLVEYLGVDNFFPLLAVRWAECRCWRGWCTTRVKFPALFL